MRLKEFAMNALTTDFFQAWEDEIAAYQEVSIILSEQKYSPMNWDIKLFQEISKQAALLIGRAHSTTNRRHDLMETMFLTLDLDPEENSLKDLSGCFTESEVKEKTEIFFRVFSNTLKTIDKLSSENKELIRTGLEMVGDNLETIADIIDRDRVYSRVGMITQNRKSILLNKRI
jgi:hypothetical protein